jgi:hypothetical protein
MHSESKVVLAKAKVADLLRLDVQRLKVWAESENKAAGEGQRGEAKESEARKQGTGEPSSGVDPALDSDGVGDRAPTQFTRQLLHNGDFETGTQSGQQFWRMFASEGASALGFSMSQPIEVAASTAAATGSEFGLKGDVTDKNVQAENGRTEVHFDTSIAHAGKRSLRLPLPEKCGEAAAGKDGQTGNHRFVEYFDLGDHERPPLSLEAGMNMPLNRIRLTKPFSDSSYALSFWAYTDQSPDAGKVCILLELVEFGACSKETKYCSYKQRAKIRIHDDSRQDENGAISFCLASAKRWQQFSISFAATQAIDIAGLALSARPGLSRCSLTAWVDDVQLETRQEPRCCIYF